MSNKKIGIVGGVGPLAGADLFEKVIRNTIAHCDQDHIDIIMTSFASQISDRTEYLLFNGKDPKIGLLESYKTLAKAGASVIGVACNTAHSKKIMGSINFDEVPVLNMIVETSNAIASFYPQGAKVGILATLGTINTGVYDEYFDSHPTLKLIKPCKETCEEVNAAIYDPEYGIKCTPTVTAKAKEIITKAIIELKQEGCDCVILGCTELPLAVDNDTCPLRAIDPTNILARNLILNTYPEKLKSN